MTDFVSIRAAGILAKHDEIRIRPNATRMNPVIRERWADALESGNWRQIKDTLHRNRALTGIFKESGQWCSLGVLCELHRRYAIEAGETEINGFPLYWTAMNGRGDLSYLGAYWRPPAIVWEWTGVPGMPELLAFDIIRANSILSFVELSVLIRAFL